MPINVEHPISYYGVLSLAMSACLYLFLSVSRDFDSLRRRLDQRLETAERETGSIAVQVASMETRLGEWADRTRDVEDTVAGLSAIRRARAVSSGVDANQRTQVLRLARRGDRSEHIAAELKVPKSEVDLLMKVQRAVIRAF